MKTDGKAAGAGAGLAKVPGDQMLDEESCAAVQITSVQVDASWWEGGADG